jgi:protein-tyrosine phosphatase
MAAEYARHRAASVGLSHVVVDSCGLLGIEGAPASDESIQVLREAGLDLTTHRSRGVRASDLRVADRVLVMTLRHLEEIAVRFPGSEGRTSLLRAFEHGPDSRAGSLDIDDPISRPLAFYREIFERIRVCVDHLMLDLKHTA